MTTNHQLKRLACCGLLLLAGCKSATQQPAAAESKAPVELPVARVQRQDLPDALVLPGTAAALPDHSVKVGPAVAGKLVAVNVVPGQHVQAGQVVARLDARQARDQANQSLAALRVAEAGVQQARTALLLARNTLAREQALFQSKIAARKDVIAAQSQVQTAQGQLLAAQAQADQARAALSQARVQAGYAAVTTPISGTVAKRFLNVGDTADASTPVAQVVDLGKVVVTANEPADTPHPIHVGEPVAVYGPGQQRRSLFGRVTAVSPVVNPQNNMIEVRVQTPNPGEQLKDGQSVTVKITTGIHRSALTVPGSALVPDPEHTSGSMVYKVGDGKIKRVPVRTGLTVGDRVEVVSGLKAGDQVVARGAYGLPDDTPIKPAGS